MNRILFGFLVLILLAGTTMAQPLLGGFVEGAQSIRLDGNNALDGGLGFGERAYPRSELRSQLTLQDALGDAEFYLRFDLLSDSRGEERSSVDLREAYLKLYLVDWLDIKLGRQVATWGTGDLVFANDLFAKDWQAFFTGLDDAYLKPPQDLLRLSFYMGSTTAELAISSQFTPDNLPDGSRLSVYNPFLGTPAAGEMTTIAQAPDSGLENGEIFGRFFGSRGSLEWALYGYKGFWPTPQIAVVPDSTEFAPYLTYPRMWSGGASLRGPLASLLVSAEVALYKAEDDADGTDPMVANSEVRGIFGVEKSLGNDWMVSGQYYGIYMLDYDGYEAGLMEGGPHYDELRSILTGRVTKMAMDQNLVFSLFGFYGVSDRDWHLRPAVSYKLSDSVKWTTGANIIGAEDTWTMFGQFIDNSSLYTRVRYSF
jgi:hypothetical protein